MVNGQLPRKIKNKLGAELSAPFLDCFMFHKYSDNTCFFIYNKNNKQLELS